MGPPDPWGLLFYFLFCNLPPIVLAFTGYQSPVEVETLGSPLSSGPLAWDEQRESGRAAAVSSRAPEKSMSRCSPLVLYVVIWDSKPWYRIALCVCVCACQSEWVATRDQAEREREPTEPSPPRVVCLVAFFIFFLLETCSTN